LAWALPAAAALFFAPPLLREAVCWGLAAAALALAWARPERAEALPPEAFLIILALGSVSAFAQRMDGYTREQDLEARPAAQAAELLRLAPELASPLTRAVLVENPQATPFGINRGLALGISTLDGFWSPQQRFLDLYFALQGWKQVPLASHIELKPGDRALPELRQLYNVRYGFNLAAPRPELALLSPTAGPAWFSRRKQELAGAAELAAALQAKRGGLPDFLHENLLVLSGDAAVQRAALPAAFAAACAQAQVLGVDAAHHAQALSLRLKSPALCPLAVAENYAEILHARGRGAGGGWRELTVFPAYGALAGILVEPGVEELVVEPRPVFLGPPLLERLAGLLFLAAALGLVLKKPSPGAEAGSVAAAAPSPGSIAGASRKKAADRRPKAR
jgi:hypothetical protein